MKKSFILFLLLSQISLFAQNSDVLDKFQIEKLANEYVENNINETALKKISVPSNTETTDNLYRIGILKNGLRANFFKSNPQFKAYYNNQVDLSKSSGGCVNPGFELGVQGFNFSRHSYNNIPFDDFSGCGTNVNTNIPAVVGPLNSNSLVSLVSPGNDPVLAPFNVFLPRVLNGQRAIRLNNDAGNNNNREIVTMSRNYTINDDQLVFNFAAVMEDNGHNPTTQPFFQVRLYDQNNNWVNQNNSNCIVTSITDCIFINSNRPNTSDQLLYIPWTCFTLDTSQLIGQQVRVEWSVGDCAWTQHFGYVYIDDVCDTVCKNPAFGSLDLLPIDGDCPEFPLTVCANYTIPVTNNGGTTTFQSSNIYVDDGSGPVNLNLTPTVTSNQICFTINEDDLLNTGTYEISVDALFQLNCNTIPQSFTLADSSTNTGDDLSFADCCQEVPCPDVSIEKEANSFTLTGDFEPGGTIVYSITVTNNEPETTCPFIFDVLDTIDTTILDETTFSSNSFGVLYNSNTDTISIGGISLLSGASQTYYFDFQIFENTLAESIENCAFVDINCISGSNGSYESCVTTQITQPESIWPRTYGGDSPINTGRHSEDVATDEDGNVYTLGNIAVKDISNEDANFLSQERGYIMKHDFFGNLVWIVPISEQYHHLKDGGLIKYFNNKLHVFTNKGYYLKYNISGSFLSAYETGIGKPAISLNTDNGNIVIAGAYYANFSNNDFSITANNNRNVGVIIKFGPTGFVGNYDYITHQTFQPNATSGRSSIQFYDIVYAENTNRIFLTGGMKGNRIFPNGEVANYEYGRPFVITLKDNGNVLNMTHNVYTQYNTNYDLIEYLNSTNKIYVHVSNRLFEIPFSEFGFGARTFIDNVFEHSSRAEDMVINQDTGNLFSVGNGFGYGEVSKISPQGRVWNRRIYEISPRSIVVGALNHYFITGNYRNDTELNLLIPYTSPIYAYGSPAHRDNIFVARFKDYGSGGIFRKQDEIVEIVEETRNNFLIYPNPSSGNISIKKAFINDNYKTITIRIRDFSGKVVFNKENIDSNLAQTHYLGDLQNGLYFMEIINNGQSIETHKIIINK